MNLPRYKFCEENKSLLINFIKKAKENKSNPYCNHAEYNILSKILPPADILDTCEDDESNEAIIISDSDEDQTNEIDINSLLITCNKSEKLLNETVGDLTSAIKEILQTEKNLTASVINDLHKPGLDLETVFKPLQEELTSEEIVAFGNSLRSNVIRNNHIISTYIKYLLLHLISLEYSEQCQLNFNDFCNKYPDILCEELCSYVLNFSKESRITQFLEAVSPDFKSKFLRHFLATLKELEEIHIPILDVLLEENVEMNTINKLMEVMSKSADSFTTNKTYGKFLLRLIQLLGKQVIALENPLNHIIGTHRSIWKAKIQKTYDEFTQHSLLMSQSFRY